jgi:hypothetical protein
MGAGKNWRSSWVIVQSVKHTSFVVFCVDKLKYVRYRKIAKIVCFPALGNFTNLTTRFCFNICVYHKKYAH